MCEDRSCKFYDRSLTKNEKRFLVAYYVGLILLVVVTQGLCR